MKKILQLEPLALALSFWVVYVVDLFFFNTGSFAILPRELVGLAGIFTAPFFHAGFYHLMSNTIPFVVLGFLVRSYGKAIFWRVFFISMVIGGLGTWFFSGASSVVGASGIVFGFWAFLMVYGILKRSFQSILIAIFVALLYGSLIFSFVHIKPYISWSGHFFGAVGGCVAAWFCAKRY